MEGSGGAKFIAIALAIALVATAGTYFVFFASFGPPDLDHDGIPDAQDPDDDNDGMTDEWEAKYSLNPRDPSDASQDGDRDELPNGAEFLRRSDPTDPDTDDDGPIDGRDIDPAVDTVVAFQYTRFEVEDPIDVGTQADVYFRIGMFGTRPVELTSSVIFYDTNAGDIPADFTTIFNVPDDQGIVPFRTTWMDRDLFFDDELDVSGIGNALDVNYSLQTHTWSGDDSDGVVSGNDDGSTTWDENDITVWYRIFDSLSRPDEINEVLDAMGSEHGVQDFNQAVRTLGHVILEQFISWALAHPEFFGRFGEWGALLATGLTILALAVKYYRLVFLQNDDR